MAGLVPAIHVFFVMAQKDVDAWHKAGHDGNDHICVLFALFDSCSYEKQHI